MHIREPVNCLSCAKESVQDSDRCKLLFSSAGNVGSVCVLFLQALLRLFMMWKLCQRMRLCFVSLHCVPAVSRPFWGDRPTLAACLHNSLAFVHTVA